MKSLNLEPSDEKILNWYLNDTIRIDKQLFYMEKLLSSIEGRFCISLDGKWGSGKTVFVKQLKMLINALNEFTYDSFITQERNKIIEKNSSFIQKGETYKPILQTAVYYDAWENDQDDDPMLSLLFCILRDTSTKIETSRQRDILKIMALVAESLTGRKVEALISELRGKEKFEGIQNEEKLKAKVKRLFDELISEKSDRLVVFIDELDRCKPDYAVRMLERIKHFMDDERVTFVISTNIEELQHTIRKHYGNRFSADIYLNRFFDLTVQMPETKQNNFIDITGVPNDESIYNQVCRQVMERMLSSIRDYAQYAQLTTIAGRKFACSNTLRGGFHDDDGRIFSLLYLVPIVIGLKISSRDLYAAFINGKDDSPLIDVLGVSGIADGAIARLKNEPKGIAREEYTLDQRSSALRDAYKAIFGTTYNDKIRVVTIGALTFSEKTRRDILAIAGLLTDFADY